MGIRFGNCAPFLHFGLVTVYGVREFLHGRRVLANFVFDVWPILCCVITWHPIVENSPASVEGMSKLRVPLPGDRHRIPVCTHYIRHLGTTTYVTILFTGAYTGVPSVLPVCD